MAAGLLVGQVAEESCVSKGLGAGRSDVLHRGPCWSPRIGEVAS